MTASNHLETRALATDLSTSPAPLFGSVLGRARSPKRQIGTGAAFAVAAHLWLLVAGLSAAGQSPPESKDAVDVTFVAALPPPPPPPPPAGGAVQPKNTPRVEKPKVDPDIYKESKDVQKPETKPEPQEERVGEEGGVEGGEEGGVEGGVVGGVKGGVVNGVLDGVLGGLGTALPPKPPPPTFTQINIGEGTDQSAPVWLGSPAAPYPPEALVAKVEATILARCNAYPDGSLRGCTIVKGNPFFDAPVLAHLGRTRVQPFTSGGKPVSGFVPINIPLRYKLPSP